MSKRVKVSDLKVTEREMPLLIHTDSFIAIRDTLVEKVPLLHICQRDGESKDNDSRYDITNCNRPLQYTIVFHEDVLNETDYRLCPRCGTRAEFQAALAKYWVAREASDRAHGERLKQKEIRRHKTRQELDVRLRVLRDTYFPDGVCAYCNRETEAPEGAAMRILFQHDGKTYSITEMD